MTKERFLSVQYQLTAHLFLSFCRKIEPFMQIPSNKCPDLLGLYTFRLSFSTRYFDSFLFNHFSTSYFYPFCLIGLKKGLSFSNLIDMNSCLIRLPLLLIFRLLYQRWTKNFTKNFGGSKKSSKSTIRKEILI